MAPHADQLPDLKAWTVADARLHWRFKDSESKDKNGVFVVRGFGVEMRATSWVDANGDNKVSARSGAHTRTSSSVCVHTLRTLQCHTDTMCVLLLLQVSKQSFLDRLLGKGGPKPRLQPSSADPSILAGAPLQTEDDVLHLRHLPDWGGALKASDVEYLLQVCSSSTTTTTSSSSSSSSILICPPHRVFVPTGPTHSLPSCSAIITFLRRSYTHLRPITHRPTTNARCNFVRAGRVASGHAKSDPYTSARSE